MMFHALVLALATQRAPKVIRHLDFHFGISVHTTETQHTSGIGATGGPISGVLDATASASNEGDISVDVVGLRPDTGLVVNVSETSRQIPHSDTTQCITWGIGTVACEPGKQATPEEQALLRFLGRSFINVAAIDSNNHWKIGTSSTDIRETTDYHITANNGGLLNISFQRVTDAQGAQGFSATTDGDVTYDSNLTVPKQIREDTMMRTQMVDGNVAMGGYEGVRTVLNLTLLTDSMATVLRQ